MDSSASADSIPKFKTGLDKPNQNISNNVPQVIQDLPPEDPSKNKLTNEEFKLAKQELVNKNFIGLQFPRTMKLHTDPPISGQMISVISFMPSKGATPDKEGCYGVMKIRGTFESVSRADSYVEMLIREHDSYSDYDYVWMGKPFPLLRDNTAYALATKEIDIRTKVSSVIKEDLKQRREDERQQMTEVQERHKQLMADVEEEKEKNFDDLDFYVQLRTKKANVLYRQDDLVKRIEEGKKLIESATKEIQELDRKFPEYKEKFLARYKESLAAAGIEEGNNPLLKYMLA